MLSVQMHEIFTATAAAAATMAAAAPGNSGHFL
jgi:hypothetical protein